MEPTQEGAVNTWDLQGVCPAELDPVLISRILRASRPVRVRVGTEEALLEKVRRWLGRAVTAEPEPGLLELGA